MADSFIDSNDDNKEKGGGEEYRPDPKQIDEFERLSKKFDTSGQLLNLELTPELEESGIVSSFVFRKKIKSIVVTLNHEYNGKIIISPINNLDWSKTQNNFEKRLKSKGIVDKNHIIHLSDVLDKTIVQ